MVFNPIRMPSSIQVTRKVQEKTNDFGDGYCQDILDGLNPIRDEISCTWNGLKMDAFTTLDNFFRENAGKVFEWNPFKEATARKWRASDWSPNYEAGFINLTVKMKEVFA